MISYLFLILVTCLLYTTAYADKWVEVGSISISDSEHRPDCKINQYNNDGLLSGTINISGGFLEEGSYYTYDYIKEGGDITEYILTSWKDRTKTVRNGSAENVLLYPNVIDIVDYYISDSGSRFEYECVQENDYVYQTPLNINDGEPLQDNPNVYKLKNDGNLSAEKLIEIEYFTGQTTYYENGYRTKKTYRSGDVLETYEETFDNNGNRIIETVTTPSTGASYNTYFIVMPLSEYLSNPEIAENDVFIHFLNIYKGYETSNDLLPENYRKQLQSSNLLLYSDAKIGWLIYCYDPATLSEIEKNSNCDPMVFYSRYQPYDSFAFQFEDVLVYYGMTLDEFIGKVEKSKAKFEIVGVPEYLKGGEQLTLSITGLGDRFVFINFLKNLH